MFSKIVIALNDLPASQRALRTGIDLARTFNAELAMVSTPGDLPVFTSLAVVDPGTPNAMIEDRRRARRELHEQSSQSTVEHGVRAKGSIVERQEVQAILHCLKEECADLLVIALPQYDFYLSRRWVSVYDLANEAPCSVVGVH